MEPINYLTPRAQQVLALARKEADRVLNSYVGSEHLLLGLIRLGQGVAIKALQNIGLDMNIVRLEVEKQIRQNYPVENNTTFTSSFKKVLLLANKEAKYLNNNYVGTEHILLGILQVEEGVTAKVLKTLYIDKYSCSKEILSMIDQDDYEYYQSSDEEENENFYENKYSMMALKTFGKDLTELAKNRILDPIIGRDEEIRRVIRILCRCTKNNPVLIGEAGVGKTAIVEGLAQEIAFGLVPEMLVEKRIIILDLPLMVAGTKYRGQFEERIKAVMEEMLRVKNTIIFLDELHTLVGAGSADGTIDASNILKPALSRGELQCIGATTLTEYRKFIEKDSALDRRFQVIKITPPGIGESIQILRGICGKYALHHRVAYTNQAIEAAVKLSDRYITARYLPDKAIDILDEAGSKASMEGMNNTTNIKYIKSKIDFICSKKEKAIKSQDLEAAELLRHEEKKMRLIHENAIEKCKKNKRENPTIVNTDTIEAVISSWTGIPINSITNLKNESQKLLELERYLQSEVIGQDHATEIIARALRRSSVNIKDPRRPIGSFMFLGPTGVGKTHLARVIAKHMFGNTNALIQIDMSEYMEKFSISRLIGSPPGYIGYEEGGQLTVQVMNNPHSVILFDEIEKSHPEIVQILLQVLEDGRLTDSLGRTVDFSHTIIIMTSNIGTNVLQHKNVIGFPVGKKAEYDEKSTKEKILNETKNQFKPEFLNRLTEIIIFSKLTRENMQKIIDLELKKVDSYLSKKIVSVIIDYEAKQFLIDKGWNEKYGARPLRRAIEYYLVDPLAEAILRNDIKKGEVIRIHKEAEKLSFNFPIKWL